jgi:hypothetical protein
METNEKVVLEDHKVYVTQSRFVAGGKTYAMSNIASVSNYQIEKSIKWPIITVLMGLLIAFLAESMLIGIILIILGAIWMSFLKNEYSVRIQSNSGESDGLISVNKEYIQQVVNAVNSAIIHRG